jgi:hypothetical protein
MKSFICEDYVHGPPAGKSNTMLPAMTTGAAQRKRKRENHKNNVRARNLKMKSFICKDCAHGTASKEDTSSDDAVRQLGRLVTRRKVAVTTNSQLPTSNEQRPMTKDRQQMSNDRRATIDYQLPTTNDQLPMLDDR